jgi:hypothetical protein
MKRRLSDVAREEIVFRELGEVGHKNAMKPFDCRW